MSEGFLKEFVIDPTSDLSQKHSFAIVMMTLIHEGFDLCQPISMLQEVKGIGNIVFSQYRTKTVTGEKAVLPICPSCDEHHPPECMCPPHEVRSPGHKNCQICKPPQAGRGSMKTAEAELASAKKIINWVIDSMYIISPKLDGHHWWRFDSTTLLGVGPTAMEALLASLPQEKTDATETKAEETH